jgi:hypothetical protein
MIFTIMILSTEGTRRSIWSNRNLNDSIVFWETTFMTFCTLRLQDLKGFLCPVISLREMTEFKSLFRSLWVWETYDLGCRRTGLGYEDNLVLANATWRRHWPTSPNTLALPFRFNNAQFRLSHSCLVSLAFKSYSPTISECLRFQPPQQP